MDTKFLLKSSESGIHESVPIKLLLERSEVFKDMIYMFDNDEDLYSALQTKVSNTNFQYVTYYYNYIYNGNINKDNAIGLLTICDYLKDIDCNYIALCIVNLCIYGNIYGNGMVVKDLPFCVECLKFLNSRQYSQFFCYYTKYIKIMIKGKLRRS